MSDNMTQANANNMYMAQPASSMANYSWDFNANNNQFMGFPQNVPQQNEAWRPGVDPRLNKSPWQPEEEMIFISKHKSFGNKWTEIAKSLEGRNDNAVKNHFYSSIRKVIRKIRKQKVTNDLKTNDVERELTIYLSQYMYEMYQEYLNKKRVEKNVPLAPTGAGFDPQNQLCGVDMEGEAKQQTEVNPKKGDKYIIRKLVSMKINPEQIQDFINLVTTGSQSAGISPGGGFQTSSANLNPSYFGNNFVQPQPHSAHMRSNSWFANDPGMSLLCNQNMGFYDQNNLAQSFAQMSLMNTNNSQANLGLGGNIYGNFEGQLSSIPPHMKPQNKHVRSNSISGMPSGLNKLDLVSHNSDTTGSNPSHMGGFSGFNQVNQKVCQDDSSFCKCHSSTSLGQSLTKPLLPPNLKLRKAESDVVSNSSYSSRSDIPSINDNVSVSSLDLSFDGAGNPTFKKSMRTSAFAKVKGGTENYDSVSEDESQNSENNKHDNSNPSPVLQEGFSGDPPNIGGDFQPKKGLTKQTGKKKSSFFRLKRNESSDED